MISLAENFYKEPLVGKKVILEKITTKHAKFLHNFYQQKQFMDCYRLAQDRDITLEELEKQIENEQGINPENLTKLEWVVKKTESEHSIIGIASLADYQAFHNRAEILIGIPNPEMRTGSTGLEASLLIFEFAFQHIHLHKLVSFVYSFNQQAQKNTIHLGFKNEGLLRDQFFNHREEKYVNLYQNGMLNSDFFFK